ncbi:hypothetical protein PHMEG_00014083 [Phytophthora megakarya]|uniref:Uncharacterized protein n=1 Tax=Phytophthora megakarya TaxID=4795 RepID=A0A225W6D0_9STRA|nr:hypothetical protein PHMEG_00014083 [Phytophthora megakarya]
MEQRILNPDTDRELNVLLEGYDKLISDLRKRGLIKISEGKQYLKSFRRHGSALIDLYKNEQRILNPDTDRELNVPLEGYDKQISDLRKRGLMKISEAKQYLKSSGYSLLALVIEEQGHKGNQTGADKYWKHIYANPYDPHICPILALAVLLFSYPDRSAGGKQQLFAGSNNKTRFGDILRKTLKQLSESEQQQLGSPTGEIAAHSLRKGSSTYTLAQVNEPNPSLGRLKDRYIHYGEGVWSNGLWSPL